MSAQPAANGLARQALLEALNNLVADTSVLAYYQQALPFELDHQLAEVVRAYTALAPHDRELFVGGMSAAARAHLGIFGHRAATLAVRGEAGDWLHLGLIANALANASGREARDIEVALAVFHHAATRLGLPAADVFEAAARYAPPENAQLLVEFGRRDDVVLKRYGWRVTQTADGLRYKFEW